MVLYTQIASGRRQVSRYDVAIADGISDLGVVVMVPAFFFLVDFESIEYLYSYVRNKCL